MVTYPYAYMTYSVSPLAGLQGGGISWRPPTYSLLNAKFSNDKVQSYSMSLMVTNLPLFVTANRKRTTGPTTDYQQQQCSQMNGTIKIRIETEFLAINPYKIVFRTVSLVNRIIMNTFIHQRRSRKKNKRYTQIHPTNNYIPAALVRSILPKIQQPGG